MLAKAASLLRSVELFLIFALKHIDDMAQYCGKGCQKAHWQVHKRDCKSPLKSHAWQPDWALQNRRPTFIGDGPPVGFGQKKYLWGNVPALDILRLEANEGEYYGEPLSLLFAGD